MVYVVSDIHGHLGQFIQLLDKIGPSEDDVVFVLGDTVDFGPNPCGVLQLMHDLPYIVPILGDHEYKAIRALRRITEEIHTDNDSLSPVLLEDIHTWFQDGGATTFQAFQQLSYE